MEIKKFLTRLTQNSDTHARWLNSLSYLEYRGFRKIVRSQRTQDIDEDILVHSMEEVRHALFFKKLAVKVGGSKFSTYAANNLLAESILKSYFYELDNIGSAMCHQLDTKCDQKKLYRLITWIVEERAMGVYRLYEEVLREQGFDFTLRPVLVDESRHLEEVQGQAAQLEDKGKSLLALEERYFRRMWIAMTSEIVQ